MLKTLLEFAILAALSAIVSTMAVIAVRSDIEITSLKHRAENLQLTTEAIQSSIDDINDRMRITRIRINQMIGNNTLIITKNGGLYE